MLSIEINSCADVRIISKEQQPQYENRHAMHIIIQTYGDTN